MNTAIKILIVEDDKDDVELINSELRKNGLSYVAQNVDNEPDYREALNCFVPDVILCDYHFPLFDGLAAFKIREEIAPETPFILVSGTIGEAHSVDLIKNGVTDLVLKNKMFTLNTKLQRALHEATERREKRKTEQDLKQSEARLVKAQAIAKIGSWETDLVNLQVTWSEETYKIFEVERHTFNPTHTAFLDLVHADDLEEVDLAFQKSFSSNSVNCIEHRIITPAGLVKHIEECWHVLLDEEGKPITAAGTCQDITERKKNEIAINKARGEKNMVLESIDDGFFALDENSIVTYWNKRAEILLDTKKEDLLGKNLHEVFLVRGSSIFYENYLKALTEKITISFEGYSNLSKKWFAVSAYGSERGLSVFFKDVTARKTVEEKLKESELRYRSLIEHASDAICVVDTNLRFVDMNSTGCQQSGYTREEFLQLSIHEVLFEEDLVKKPLLIPTLTPGTTFLQERRLKLKDGSALETELSGKMLEDGNVLIFIRDITERNKAAHLISESEAKYRAFFENSMDGILLTVPDGAILAANPAACEIFQMTEEEICTAGKTGLADVSDPRMTKLIKERQMTGRAKGELTFVRKDGSRFPGEISSVLFKNAVGHLRSSMIIRDITRRKTAELQLRQTSAELQHTLNGLHKIMDFSMDIICTVDEAGKFVQVSAAAESIWGYSPKELINVNYSGFVMADDVEKTATQIIEVKNGHPINSFENSFVHKNGSIVPMLWSANWDEQDQLLYCIGRDATEKKRLEKANEIERQRFLGLFLQAPSCMGILKGPNHVYEMANPLYLELINKTDIIGKTVKEVLPELESQGVLELLDEVYTTGNSFSANEMLVQFNFDNTGGLVDTYLNFIYQAHRNDEGEIDGILFFVIDVTEQVVSRQKIEESGKRYRMIVETAQEGIWMIDAKGKTSFVNQKMCDILGYAAEEMMGQTIYAFMDEEGRQLATDLMHKQSKGQVTQEHFKYISKSGKEVWTNLSANPLFDEHGAYTGSLAMVTDITEKKQAELQLKESNERYNLISRATNDMVWDWDLATGKVERNREGWKKIFRIGNKEIEPETIDDWDERVHPDDREKVKKVEDEIQRSERDFFEVECRVLRDDGTYAYVHDRGFVLRNEQGEAIRLIGATQDITERKNAEAAVLFTLTEKNTILESIGDAFFAVDKNWTVTYWNKHAEKILGVLKEKIVGQHLWGVFTDNIGSSSYLKYQEGMAGNEVVQFEDYHTPIGRWYEISAYPSESGLAVYFKDITERKQAEIQLKELNANLQVHARELAISNMELEQFAYVASHDLQEPLRMVSSFLMLLEKKYDGVIDDRGRKYIGFAVDGAKRMRQIILDLLEFSRVGRTDDELESIDLNGLIDEIKILFRKQIIEKKAVIVSDTLPHVRGYRSPLRQVFQNLVSNSLKYSGKARASHIQVTCTEMQDHWQFAVKDNGMGIDREYFEKIFIIFQRLHTRDEYSGTGMGLAITKKILENQGGRIWLESETGKGSTFYFTLLKN